MTTTDCGGPHSASNLVMACFSCNSAKKDKTKEEFLLDRCQDNMRLNESSGEQVNNICCDISSHDFSRIEHAPNAVSQLSVEPSHPRTEDD